MVESNGQPVVGVEVVVESVERDGKFAAYATETITDGTGAFRAEVELAGEGGGRYRAWARASGYLSLSPEPVRVLPREIADLGSVPVERPGEPAAQGTGPFTLDVLVEGPDGRPVPDARVELCAVVDLPVPEGSRWPSWWRRDRGPGDGYLELRGPRGNTGAAGLVRLEGERLGAKLLRIRRRAPSSRPASSASRSVRLPRSTRPCASRPPCVCAGES